MTTVFCIALVLGCVWVAKGLAAHRFLSALWLCLAFFWLLAVILSLPAL